MIEKTPHVLFAIVGVIMRVALPGAFGAMVFTIGKYGPVVAVARQADGYVLSHLSHLHLVVLDPSRDITASAS
jgi:aerobic C4-dicarboxylate transport protein